MWREGWRNLHGDGPTVLSARFRVDGEKQPLVGLGGRGAADASLDGGERIAVSGARASWDALGWDAALAQFRPLLSYNELGARSLRARRRPLRGALRRCWDSREFDDLSATLRAARLDREKSGKTEKLERKALIVTIAATEGDRAATIAPLLAKMRPDVDAIEAAAAGAFETDEDGRLHALAALPLPDDAAIDSAFAALLASARGCPASRGHGRRPPRGARSPARRGRGLPPAARRGGHLPRLRNDRRPRHGMAHPLAGGDRGAPPTQRGSAGCATCRWRGAACHRRAVPCDLGPSTTTVSVLHGRAGRPWRARATTAGMRRSACSHRSLGARGGGTEAERRQSAWGPIQADVASWVATARRAEHDKETVVTLKGAEVWMAACTAALRRERLLPIVESAQANWAELRHESNVALGDVELRKEGNRRYASFDVSVDGSASSAFGVMSQGELSALAVSIFLPRASLPESPFGFMVIDDPVQSMDPAKVDGLARVLADAAAETRQVVVFTHDERLPEAVRRLGHRRAHHERPPSRLVEGRGRRRPLAERSLRRRGVRVRQDRRRL